MNVQLINKAQWAKLIVVTLLILLIPFGIQQLVQYRQVPNSITIATGKIGGRYREIMSGLGGELQRKLGIEVNFVESPGSSENIKMLVSGEVDIALCQPNVLVELRSAQDLDLREVKFIASVFPEVALVHVSKTAEGKFFERVPSDEPLNVAMGEEGSGDAITTQLLLEFFEIDGAVEKHYLNYEDVLRRLQSKEMDVAVVTTGKNAKIQRDLSELSETQILSIPFVNALVERNPLFRRTTIPAGYYQTSPPYPAVDIDTIGIDAQLLTHSRVSAYMVSLITETLLDPAFLAEMELNDLNRGGVNYARSDPSVPLHDGASHFYEPGLKPLFNPEFVDNTESLRSFFVSILVAAFLIWRWLKTRQLIRSEHRLDRFMARLLEIEREQVELAEGPVRISDCDSLEEFLDEITALRSEAMSSFSATDLIHDTGTECFIMLSNSISDKINAKLTRLQLRHELMALNGSNGESSKSDGA